MRFRWSIFFLILLGAVVFVGQPGLDLDERQGLYEPVEFTVAGDANEIVPPGLEIRDGRLSFFNGCNFGAGTIDLRGNTLRLDDFLIDAFGCPEDYVPSTVGTLIAAEPNVTFSNEGLLVLTDGDRVLTMQLVD